MTKPLHPAAVLVPSGLLFCALLALFLQSLCLACTAEDRAGHRMDFSVMRADMGSASSVSTLTTDGPGPHDATASSSTDGGGDGWLYGVGYSIPVGESQDAAPLRLLVAHLAGLRAENEQQTKATQASIDRLTDELHAVVESLTLGEARRAAESRKESPSALTEPEKPPSILTSETDAPASEGVDDDLGWLGTLGIGSGALGAVALAWKFRSGIWSVVSWPFT